MGIYILKISSKFLELKVLYLIVQRQLCTICKNPAPHVNFCHPVVLKSYGSKVSKKIGWHFFKPGSRSFQGHIISNVRKPIIHVKNMD